VYYKPGSLPIIGVLYLFNDFIVFNSSVKKDNKIFGKLKLTKKLQT
jgi:hypothetical protein